MTSAPGSRCRQCGRAYPTFVPPNYRPIDSDPFKDSGRCLACRLGTRGAQIQPQGRDALKHELVRLNARRKKVKRG